MNAIFSSFKCRWIGCGHPEVVVTPEHYIDQPNSFELSTSASSCTQTCTCTCTCGRHTLVVSEFMDSWSDSQFHGFDTSHPVKLSPHLFCHDQIKYP